MKRIFWTDGSAVPNPGRGGYAVLENEKPMVLGCGNPVVSGGYLNEKEGEETNIQMEGCAIRSALVLAGGEECEIHTDSEFWKNVLEKWAPGWKANGWKKKSKGEIANLELVKEVYGEYEGSKAKLVWERGHAGTRDNELVDRWANVAREGKEITEEDYVRVEKSAREGRSLHK